MCCEKNDINSGVEGIRGRILQVQDTGRVVVHIRCVSYELEYSTIEEVLQ